MFLKDDFKQITENDALNLEKGDVILVRSDYAPEKYGDHYSLVVGGLIIKDRGLRPNLVTFPPIQTPNWLDEFTPINGKIILKLSAAAAAKVLTLYGVHLSEGELLTDKNRSYVD